ncbi:uncharacterized protein BDR25DRAFT_331670 [Lindgomyces ingoldianus]|uniref:Uncharacterized protein n=1 Tax=Lindgomyces ingoldianus TaxID=673940 RepID=A0ACB6RBH9_9PLEO|nr:uncharacterized protein BDR25DRAFT_331670 [Lindgomyces ingoldianus]KAF2476108.1 hypothetical protein BDR25DRAFT_331670 [Lindgomyces ingoldianus]
MVYDWGDKEAECFRLYVQEKKSLDEVLQYWQQKGFTPSKRAFQTQFKRWGFPSKQNPAHKNPALIARVKQLWENNIMQKDMLEILQSEGFQINDRELVRVRLKFKWLLRESRATEHNHVHGPMENAPKKERRKVVSCGGDGFINELDNAILQKEDSSEEYSEEDLKVVESTTPSRTPPLQTHCGPEIEPEPAPLDPEELRRRQERLVQLQAESDERWRTRKRRRRTRGWAGLPADAPGEPPRFPSETTIDESKAYLSLSNKEYRQIREQFQVICEEHGVLKKTLAGPEKWGYIKDQLIRKNEHLSSVFQQDPEARQQNVQMSMPSNVKALSLDVICLDVTKRMRVLDNRMRIPEAKNALGLNPEETRQVRKTLVAKLKADHFTSRLEAGDERWNELKQTWIQESDLLSTLLAASAADPKHAEKTKAVDVLARDVMKRFRQENTKKDPSRKAEVNQGPGPGPAPASVVRVSNSLLGNRGRTPRSSAKPTNNDLLPIPTSSDLQIDPSLLLAANDPSVNPHSSSDSLQPQAHHNPYVLASQFYSGVPLPIYFRLHPHSSTTVPNKTVWLGILQGGTVAEIRNLATREHPGTVVVKIEGLIVHKMDHSERDILFTIDEDDELAAYLGHVGGGKATFIVLMAAAQGGVYV